MNVEYWPYRTKSMINELKHVDDWLWVNYTLNPNRGCAHLCVYCDARDDRYGLSGDFDRTVYFKGGAVDVLKRQLPKLRRACSSRSRPSTRRWRATSSPTPRPPIGAWKRWGELPGPASRPALCSAPYSRGSPTTWTTSRR